MVSVTKSSCNYYGVLIEEALTEAHSASLRLELANGDLSSVSDKILRFHADYVSGRKISDISPTHYHEQINTATKQIHEIGSEVFPLARRISQKLADVLHTVERPPISEKTYEGMKILNYNNEKVRISVEALKEAAKIVRVYSERFFARLNAYDNTRVLALGRLEKARKDDPLSKVSSNFSLFWWKGAPNPLPDLIREDSSQPSPNAPQRERPDFVKQFLETEMGALPSMNLSPIVGCLAILLSDKRNRTQELLLRSTPLMERKQGGSSLSEGTDSVDWRDTSDGEELSSQESRNDIILPRDSIPSETALCSKSSDVVSLHSLGDLPDHLFGTRSILENPDISPRGEVSECSWERLTSLVLQEENDVDSNLPCSEAILEVYQLREMCVNTKTLNEKRLPIVEKVLLKISDIQSDLIKLLKKKPTSELEKTVHKEMIEGHRKNLMLFVQFFHLFNEEVVNLRNLRHRLGDFQDMSVFSGGFGDEEIATLTRLRFFVRPMLSLNELVGECNKLIDDLGFFIVTPEKLIKSLTSELNNCLYYLKRAEGSTWFYEGPLSYITPGQSYLQEAMNTLKWEDLERDPSWKAREMSRIEACLRF